MSERIAIGVYVTRQEYRVLTQIANEKTTDPTQPVQAHHLIERLIRNALSGTVPQPPAKPKRAPRVLKTGRYGQQIDMDELRRLHSEGMTDAAIADTMNAPRSTVGTYRRILGLPVNYTPNRSPVDEAEFRRLHAMGLVDRVIGERLGFSTSKAHDYRNHLGLPKNTTAGRKPNKEKTA